MSNRLSQTVVGLGFVCFMQIATAQLLAPPPESSENPVTEPKRVLGKILFWEEQLSSDDTVACGTCHIPAAGGAIHGFPRTRDPTASSAQKTTRSDLLESSTAIR